MQWKYETVHLGRGNYVDDPDGPTEAEPNALGADGWELAASLTGRGLKFGGRGSATKALVFKGPVEDDDGGGAPGRSGPTDQ